MSAVVDSREVVPRSRGLLIGAAVLAVIALLLAVRVPIALRSYREMFSAFGSNLSPLTRFMLGLESVWWLWAAASAGLLIWVGLRPEVPQRVRRMQWIVLVSTIVLIGWSYAILAYAIYTEIYRLGATV